MAKAEMICPFSGKLCKECAIYRGRHYFLCFNKNYRGYLKKPGEMYDLNSTPNFRATTEDLFHLQVLTKTKALDPYAVSQNDIG